MHDPLSLFSRQMDPEKLRVFKGRAVSRGQIIGIASFCGMLDVEVYRGVQTRPIVWRPPQGLRAKSGENCASKVALGVTRDQRLMDPRPLLTSLEGKFCK
jgi:hypothetical protein